MTERNTYPTTGKLWYSVSTPSVFEEYLLPESESDRTRAEQHRFEQLEDLAERHRTHVQSSTYRRG